MCLSQDAAAHTDAATEPDSVVRPVLLQQGEHPRRVGDVADVHVLPRGTKQDALRFFLRTCEGAAIVAASEEARKLRRFMEQPQSMGMIFVLNASDDQVAAAGEEMKVLFLVWRWHGGRD